MDQKKLFKQMLDFNKSAFENSFNAMVMLQEQAERVGNTILDQATWLPEEGRKAVQDWVDSFKKGRSDFKSMIDENYQRVEGYFSEGDE
jgi:polyhydroxyalkanoate synthesis regulator phasin